MERVIDKHTREDLINLVEEISAISNFMLHVDKEEKGIDRALEINDRLVSIKENIGTRVDL